MDYLNNIFNYQPTNEQEARDKELILTFARQFPDLLTRENPIAHITASSWIVNYRRTKVLLAYHRIYDSWSWTGGHADGDGDLLEVALREAKEETGIETVRPLSREIFSLECACVDGHMKNGRYVSSHLHLNITFLLEADDTQPLRVNPAENKDVRWFTLEEALLVPREKWMVEKIYSKLNKKLTQFLNQ
jgi:8-oxo-dGTP pyrophosphatase MutT (NUDIX family)